MHDDGHHSWQPDFMGTLEGWADILERGLRRDDLSAFFPYGVVLLPREHPESWQARLKAVLIRQGKWPPQPTK